MSATLLYRIASVVLILFAAGHTVGFLKFTPGSAEGVAVLNSMNSVPLQVGSLTRTYGGFYRGFGLFNTVYLLFTAFLAWHLSGLTQSNPKAIASMAWAFFALQLVSLALSWIYFLPPPVILSAIAAVCTGWAAWLVSAAAR